MSIPRIAGLVAAATLGMVLIAVAYFAIGPDRLVVPTNGVTSGGPQDNPAGRKDLGALQARTRMQQWPQTGAEHEAGAQPGATRPSLALGEPQDSQRTQTQEWLDDRSAKQDILNEARYRDGSSTLPAAEAGVLMQPQGRTWRRLRNDQVAYGGAFYIFGVSFLIAGFLAWRGRVALEEGESGHTIERFTAFERANHWLTAGSFVLLALTGLVVLYGDALLRPWLGAGAYADLAGASAWSHMMFAVPFLAGVIVMVALWTRQNLPEWLDWEWLKRGGGFLGDHGPKPPARKFNAGQKIVFWGVALGGLALAASGLALMFPLYWTGYAGMQIMLLVHASLGLLMVGLIIGHIYIGTIGMVGAFDAMWSGRVDRNWAKEHHSLWEPEAAAQQQPDDRGAARAPQQRSSWTSFAAGIGVAIVVAAAMAGVYNLASESSIEHAGKPSVHVDLR